MPNVPVETELIIEDCCDCGVLFGLEKRHRKRLLDTGAWFYCPNGHKQHYTESTEAKLKKQIQYLEDDRNWYQNYSNELRAERDDARNHLRAERGAKTRLKKRMANGVCPCCNRLFVNLQNHMQTEHPEYATETETE